MTGRPIGRTTSREAPLLRAAGDADMAAVTAIYAHHVATGLATFEEIPPPLAEMCRRRDHVLARGLPFLVAEMGGAVRGYAYADYYRERSAYRYAVEDSIYVDAAWGRRGIGRALLAALIEHCIAAGMRRMISVIGDSGNAGSIALHEAAGFDKVGVLPSCGYKLGRWVDSVLMARALGDGDEVPPAT